MNVTILGGSTLFRSFLSRITEGVSSFSTLSDAIADVRARRSRALFILPDYDGGRVSVDEFTEAEMNILTQLMLEERTNIYLENYPAYDYRDCFVLGLQARTLPSNVGRYTICLSEKLKATLGFDILQKRGGYYLPAEKHTSQDCESLADIKSCIGVHTVIHGGERVGTALLRCGSNVWSAMVDFTNLKSTEIFSYKHWRDFYAYLFAEILGAERATVAEAFEKTYEGVETARTSRPRDRKAALENAVREAVEWHGRSGILLDGGRRGVYEMIRSFDLGTAKNVRGDSSMLTAALYMAAGKYFDEDGYKKIAENILHHILNERGLQISEGENRGLFSWFSGTRGLGARQVYVSDTSRVGNAVTALYKLTGDESLLERIKLLGEALLRWFGGDHLLPVCNFDYDKATLSSIQRQKKCSAPEFYDAPLLFFKNLYSVTGDERYRKQILGTARALAERYPDYDVVASHSYNFTYSRLLGAFAAAECFESGPWTPLIDGILEKFNTLQHECGGFAELRAYFDEKSISRDMEFAVGLGTEYGNIADLVYCNSTMLYALSVLLSSERGGFDRELAEQLFERLTDFFLDTQITSHDTRSRGGWMRAYDMDNAEYYGCDKDFAWGPYCILTGWVTGTVPLVFLDLLGLDTVY
jgi:hypothetical protein